MSNLTLIYMGDMCDRLGYMLCELSGNSENAGTWGAIRAYHTAAMWAFLKACMSI